MTRQKKKYKKQDFLIFEDKRKKVRIENETNFKRNGWEKIRSTEEPKNPLDTG